MRRGGISDHLAVEVQLTLRHMRPAADRPIAQAITRDRSYPQHLQSTARGRWRPKTRSSGSRPAVLRKLCATCAKTLRALRVWAPRGHRRVLHASHSTSDPERHARALDL